MFCNKYWQKLGGRKNNGKNRVVKSRTWSMIFLSRSRWRLPPLLVHRICIAYDCNICATVSKSCIGSTITLLVNPVHNLAPISYCPPPGHPTAISFSLHFFLWVSHQPPSVVCYPLSAIRRLLFAAHVVLHPLS